MGRVKSLKYNKERILKFRNCQGYDRCLLTKDKLGKNIFVHRIVAKAFIPNPNNYLIINHIDGNRRNNNVNNLEWCNQSYNVKHAFKIGTKKPSMLGKKYSNNPNSKKIIQYDKNDIYIKMWSSIQEASDELNISNVSISYCCNNKKYRKTAGGYKWKFYKGDDKNFIN